MKLPDLLWCQRVETVGWDYENWLQQEYGLEDEVVEEAEEEIEEVEIDVSNLKPGVNLLKVKIADWKDNDHYAILGLQDIRYKERYYNSNQMYNTYFMPYLQNMLTLCAQTYHWYRIKGHR